MLQKLHGKTLAVFNRLKNQSDINKTLIQDMVKFDYKFKITKENAETLKISFLSSQKQGMNRFKQIMQLQESILTYLIEIEANKTTQVVEDENEYIITFSSNKSTINQLLSWLNTFNSSHLLTRNTASSSVRFFNISPEKLENNESEFDCKLQ